MGCGYSLWRVAKNLGEMIFIKEPLFFLFVYFLFFPLLRVGTRPYVYAIAGGAAAHMALMAGGNASSLPKSLAVAWPVNLIPLFLYAVIITSAAFLVFLRAGTKVSPGDALALGLGLYNYSYGLMIASAVYSLPRYSELAEPLLLSGLITFAGVEVFVLRAVASSTKSALKTWPVPAITFPAGWLSYWVLPPLSTDIYPRLILATAQAGSAALIVYAMFRNNLVAASLMGGLSSYKFWASLFGGVMLYAVPEVLIHLYHPAVHAYHSL